MKTFIFIVSLILFSGVDCLAQRCGDDIWIYFRDSNAQVIAPEEFDSVKVSVDGGPDRILDKRHFQEVPNEIQSFTIPTGCGLRVARITLTFRGKEMVMEIKNVLGDSGNILIESVPFREGVYELDLENSKMSGCESAPW